MLEIEVNVLEELGKKIDQLSNKVTELRIEIWTKYTLFSWQWWMLLAASVLIVVLFFIIVKKEKLLQSIAFLGVIYILNKNLDDVATALDWYDYRIQLEPIIPTMLPANLIIIPMGLSMIYQRFEKWKSFFIALAVFSGFVSFVSLPLMKWADIYLQKSWNAGFSFLSLLIMGTVSKLVIDRAVLISKVHRSESRQDHKYSKGKRRLILPFPFLRWFRKKERAE
ncbi:hypothetical protein [Ammoniphilus sp. CFH 90114]|uniref:hypothetical protein n=1 Tax=Ammoniphilus sp. CFH 90114 TaxID=2493665 RepID=UPI00196B2986|nr:hypothetical protein [Ammoniphilus sp. CFH 90114]